MHMPAYGLQSWAAPVSSIPKHCCAHQHLTAGGGAVRSCPLWDLSSGHWESVWNKWSEPTEKNFTRCAPLLLHCVLQRWLGPGLCLEGRGFAQLAGLYVVQWVEAGIKPVQRGNLCWRGVRPAALVGGRCWQGWASWHWQYVRLLQRDRSKGGLERAEGVVTWLLAGLLCVHVHHLDLPGQLGLPGKDTY